MSFRLTDEGGSPAGDGRSEADAWKRLLETGSRAEREQAAGELTRLGAEPQLTECLASADAFVVQLATRALWECWMNEQGPAARRAMDKGIRKMNGGQLEDALTIFGGLVKQYPRWAEAYNKQATVLYLLGNARLSYKVCQVVVELKPNHFGAWNGLALCAAQLERWPEALQAARKALSLQPGAQANVDLIQLARAKLAEQGPGPGEGTEPEPPPGPEEGGSA